MTYLYLAIAIVAETIATSALKLSESFSRPVPSAVTVVGYAIAFYCLSLVLRSMPTGVAYAIWSGVGIVLISIIGWAWMGQTLNWQTMFGMGLIIVGVVVVNLYSSAH
ncbi:DMT family transporter [Hydrogenophaga palleronii]|uniref:DMT family transporter n=1 Tax=Hydrogenophaga palleronii TaxID=65655 RepID=UPI00082687A9|nr:multidrug efflux SMR transporter [Hydrogenophaga palleronii]